MQALYFAGDWLRDRARERMVVEGRLAPHRAQGQRGEDLAHRYLQKQGMRIMARNWRTRSGNAEIDLIAWDESDPADAGVLVFVEVKTRASDVINAPERQIDFVKRRNMARGAGEFVRRFAPGQERMRFDVVTIVLGSPVDIKHWRDAFVVMGEQRRQPSETGLGAGAGFPR